jgi:hypothetical protein
MDKRTTGIVATIVAVLLCGCPGLFALCFGALTAFAGAVPGSSIDIFGSSDPQTALLTGIGVLCLGLIFVAIPVVVGFVTLRNRPAQTSMPSSDESLPPAN